MLSFIAGLIFSIALISLVLLTKKYHWFFSYDHDLTSIQKYHSNPVPRIGGVAIFVSFIIVVLLNKILNCQIGYEVSIILTVTPVFIIGILEDISKKISPSIRLIIITLSVLSAIFVIHTLPIITYADFGYLDVLIHNYPIIGIILTLFCVVGLTNSYNIIDGYNGLSSTMAILNLIGLAIIAHLCSNVQVFQLVIIFCATILGFFVFNYPWGKIFLGDGGAYFIGFVISVLSIYLIHVAKGGISPYSMLLMAIYPVTEMGFSIYRRKVIHRTRSTLPDNAHLHQLVYHQCIPYTTKNKNMLVMPLLLVFMLPQVILAVIFYKSTFICLSFVVLYVVFYVTTYFRLVHFKPPWFLKILL